MVGSRDLRTQPQVVDLELLLLVCGVDERRKLADAIGLGQVIIGPELHRLDGRFDSRLAGEHDDLRRVLALLASAPQQLDTVEPRHIDIAQQDVKIVAFEHRPGRLAVLGTLDLMALPGHFLLDHEPEVFFVIND